MHHCNKAVAISNQKTTASSQNGTGGAGNECHSAAPKLPFGYPIEFPEHSHLRQRPSLEDCCVVAAAAGADEEHHVLTALHLRLEPLEVGFAVHRLLVDLEDHVAAAQSGVIAEATGLHVLHDDAPGAGELIAVGHLRSDAPHGDAELALLRLGLLSAFIL